MKKAKKKSQPVNLYHFDLTKKGGAAGFTACVYAPSPKKAVEELRKAVSQKDTNLKMENKNVQYLMVFFNKASITEKDIDGEVS